jgi:hypothetical protein
MAVNILPTTIFADWAEDGTDITLPIASLPELTDAEADAVTGDSRAVMFALVDQMESAFNDIIEADRPTKMSITKNADIAVGGGEVVRNYTFSFYLTPATVEVSDEPTPA